MLSKHLKNSSQKEKKEGRGSGRGKKGKVRQGKRKEKAVLRDLGAAESRNGRRCVPKEGTLGVSKRNSHGTG